VTPRNSTSGTGGQEPWYARGLRFECSGCGRCCGGEPGYVWLGKEEIRTIARFLKMPQTEFLKRYCRRVLLRISLRERANGDCVFLTANKCAIYPVRPWQCRSFPFWPHVLSSPDGWAALKSRCPGVDRGRLYNRQQIESIRDGERST